MVEWMRGQGWRLPEQTHVIPLVTRSGATGESPPRPAANENGGVHRLAFFGRLEIPLHIEVSELEEGLAFLAENVRLLRVAGEPEFGTPSGIYGLQRLPLVLGR